MDRKAAQDRLRNCDISGLFTQELGWDWHRENLSVLVDKNSYELEAIAHKRGMVAYLCPPLTGKGVPDYATRRKIEGQVAKQAHEHLIIFTDAAQNVQVWQWVKREAGKPAACREHTYHKSQPGDALLQKLQAIAFSLEEEENLTLVDVTRRTRQGFDVEKITKRFFDQFQKEHGKFLDFIDGITESTDREWYASVMLNRLMFVYFIQRKGFLDGDEHYLRNRLNRCKQEKGEDKFYSFYRYFLLRLFHEGFGKRPKDRAADLEKLLGKIPYLNGGFFEQHQIELRYDGIQIPDKAFERIFNYFDQYQWHLDERPLRADNEINPDVLGFIFEKYINQKQMGAYYTKEDITEYISKNTIIPFLFDAARAKCKVAFEKQPETPSNPVIWDLLSANPDKYIYPAVRHGADLPLPAEIKAGVKDVSKRTPWNKPAPAEFALPTEIWREVIARRERCDEIRKKLAVGEIREINDLITLNLDIRQFAQDVIERCEGPELLRAFWHAIEKITVLDPTCGSGAFLFAALNILEPLYEACLERMETFVAETSGEKHRPEKFSDFKKILHRVDVRANRRYFIFKSIILNNLFGVDIMEEAVEICKLRLFLKLAAQVEPDAARDNLGIEPLPDIDFNVRAGNSLVGYSTVAEVRKCMTQFGDGQMRLGVEDELQSYSRFMDNLQIADSKFNSFRKQQTELGGAVTAKDKHDLQTSLKTLENELNGYLSQDYAIDTRKQSSYIGWLRRYHPFHWLVEFYGIMKNGGFDAIIGNPPYVELKALEDYQPRGYECEESGNLYALVMERCASIVKRDGRQGYIVPVSSISTERYESLQRLLLQRVTMYSSYDDRPSRLFDGLEHIRLTIHLLGHLCSVPRLWSTRYNKWTTEERVNLFAKLNYTQSAPAMIDGSLPKFTLQLERSILNKMFAQRRCMASYYSKTGSHRVFYSRKVGYFLQVLDFPPRVLDGRGRLRAPSEFKELRFATDAHAKFALCCFNSNLFYWFVTVFSDCRHVNKREIDAFPVKLDAVSDEVFEKLVILGKSLMKSLKATSIERVMSFAHDTLTVQCIYPKASKHIIDEIDEVLAQYYGFTNEELDFLVNYDVKHRLGNGSDS